LAQLDSLVSQIYWFDYNGFVEPSDSWWKRVKYYARLAIERVEDGVDAVKQLLSTLTIDERCGVMLEFEDASPEKFGQLVADAPQWTEWMA
jgi:hypothetical protein